MRKLIDEFKSFAMRGNVIDLAVGIIIGGAFGKIVTSLVNDIVMPLLGLIIGRINFSSLKYVISKKSGSVEELSIKYGQFIQSIIDFLIIAFCIFLIIKLFNAFKKKEEQKTAVPTPSRQEQLLEEIRDLLKNK